MLMHAGYKILSISNADIVSLKEVKQYLKIQGSEEDDVLKSCVLASIETAENFLNFALRVKEVALTARLGHSTEVKLTLAPVIELVSCILQPQNLDVTRDCTLDNDRLKLPGRESDKVQIVYKAGFADPSTIPSAIKHGILYHVAELYDKQIVSISFMDEILAFYKPFRRILI